MNVIDLTKPNMIRYPKGGDVMEKTKPKDESLEIELEIGYLLELPEMSYDQMDRYETLVVDYPEVHKRIHKEVRGK